jgi:hypothetical protein
MPAPPLTHHEILELAEPFTRSGRRVDLGATRRAERKLVFMGTDRAAAAPGDPGLRETLQLESAGEGAFELTRLLASPAGLTAKLRATGPQPAALLAQIDAVAPAQQFRFGPGHAIARSYEIVPLAGAAAAGGPRARCVLIRGVAQVDGLLLTMDVMAISGVAAGIELLPAGSEGLDLPEDLLAVLGWDWARLVRTREGWTSKLRLRGKADRRTRSAEGALDAAAAHLARTLAALPGAFHERHLRARWGVTFRRAIPTLTAVALIAATVTMPRLPLGPQSAELAVLLHYLSIGVLALSFGLQELPQFEIPPWPRRSRATRWHAGRALPDAGAPRGRPA